MQKSVRKLYFINIFLVHEGPENEYTLL